MKAFSRLLTAPLRGWAHLLRLLRDPHARWVAALFFTVLALMLALGWLHIKNTGFGFFFRGCAAGFSEGRLALLLMLTPIAFALALSSIGEAIRWMEAKRRHGRYKLHDLWRLLGLGGILLLAVYLLTRC